MQRLEHDEERDLYQIEGNQLWFETAADALWFGFYNSTTKLAIADHAASVANIDKAAFGGQNPERIQEAIEVFLKKKFTGYLRFVCMADEEEAEETSSMIDFGKYSAPLVAWAIDKAGG